MRFQSYTFHSKKWWGWGGRGGERRRRRGERRIPRSPDVLPPDWFRDRMALLPGPYPSGFSIDDHRDWQLLLLAIDHRPSMVRWDDGEMER